MIFTKMQALGNDYIYINNISQKIEDPSKLARFVSDRHYGIGSDGMVLICGSNTADFRMRIFNPDGSEAEMCGNAIRSVAKYVYVMGLTTKMNFFIETLGGIKEMFLDVKNGDVTMITASIGAPIFDYKLIPATLSNADGRVIDFPVTAAGMDFNVTAMSFGNPHCAVFVEDVMKIDLPLYGGAIENHEIFPRKTNVEFLTVVDRKTLKLRTWERNCGETLACGLGCATGVVAGFLTDRCDNKATVIQLGGNTLIEWELEKNNILMTAPSMVVCDGSFDWQQ